MSEPKQYRKRPVVVEAVQYDGTNAHSICTWSTGNVSIIEPEDRGDDPDCDLEVLDDLHNTWIKVYKTQWIIRGTKGEYYPCADDVFQDIYEAV
jgi:hypothetical protein